MQPAACNLQLGSNNDNNNNNNDDNNNDDNNNDDNNNDDNNNNDILILIIIVTQVGSALPSQGCRKPYIHHHLMPVTEMYLHTLCSLNSGTVMRLMLL